MNDKIKINRSPFPLVYMLLVISALLLTSRGVIAETWLDNNPNAIWQRSPGVYKEGEYGIRLENMILVEQAFENDFGTFMKFKNMTYCHFERNLIDETILSQKEIEWINAYHANVYEKLSPVLRQNVALWLKDKTLGL